MPPKGPPKKRKADGLDEVQPSSSSGGGAGPEVSASIDDTSGGQTGQQQQTTTNVGILYVSSDSLFMNVKTMRP